MYELFILFTLGLIVGSFLNVVIIRHNTGSSLSGRSGCMSCAESLSWWELLPVVSFFVLRGKCKSCGSAISFQYPAVEIVVATLFVLLWLQEFSLFHFILALVISALLVIIAVYDFKHTIIPGRFVYSFIISALLWHLPKILWMPIFDMLPYFGYVLLSGVLAALPFAFLWFISKGEWIGLGDAKLMLGIGLMLGLWGSVVVVTIASVLGSISGLAYIAWRKLCIARLGIEENKSKMRVEVPFGPFLVLGFLVVWLFEIDIAYLNLFNL